MEFYKVTGDELQHHGIKGMRWGQRRFQNKDGSLTPAGQKRYNKELERLKQETAKVKAERKFIATRKKNQAKLDKLESERRKLEEQKKALKDEKREKKTDDSRDKNQPEETLEQRRERVLKSTNAKEIYENKDILTSTELNERINRIDLEARLQSKIPVEKQKTAMDRINESIAMYKKVDEVYSTVAKSEIGKVLGKKLGLNVKTEKPFDLEEFWENRNKKSSAEVKEVRDRLINERIIAEEREKRRNRNNSTPDNTTTNANNNDNQNQNNNRNRDEDEDD